MKSQEDIERLSSIDQDCLERIVELLFEKNVPLATYSKILDFFYVKSRTVIFGTNSFTIPDVGSGPIGRQVITTKKSDFPMPLLRKSLNSLWHNEFISKNTDDSYELAGEFADLAYEMHSLLKHNKKAHTGSSEDIPAADRFVTVDHNSKEFLTVRQSLEGLSASIVGANDLTTNHDDRLIISKEIDHLKDLISAPRLQTSMLWNYTKENSFLSGLWSKLLVALCSARQAKPFGI